MIFISCNGKSYDFDCQHSIALIVIVLLNKGGTFEQGDGSIDEFPCVPDFSVKFNIHREYPNGSIWDDIGSSMYENGTYWREKDTENDGEDAAGYHGCPCLLSKPCLRKCCPMGEAITTEGECVQNVTGSNFELEVTEDDGSNPRRVDGKRHFGLLYGPPQGCHRKFSLRPGVVPGDDYFLRGSDGRLVMYVRNISYGPFIFCMDMILEEKEYRPFICEPQEEETFARELYPHLLMISALFLLITFSIYMLIPELRNLHGKILMCHVMSFFLMFFFFAMTEYLGRRLSYWMCISAAFLIQYFLYATFFWLNIMCFDICFTISIFQPTSTSCPRQEQRKFVFYSLYAWGSPTIIFIITSIMQFTPRLPDHIIKPHFGEVKCYFHSYDSLVAYLYGPITTLLSVNIITFIVTAAKIYQVNKDSHILRRGCYPAVDCIKERFFLYIKLFIVMGLSWMMDFIAWIVPTPAYYFYFTEIWNSLQGVIIFIIFVCKRGILNMLSWRFCPPESRSEAKNLNKGVTSSLSNCRPTTRKDRGSNRTTVSVTLFPTTPMEEAPTNLLHVHPIRE